MSKELEALKNYVWLFEKLAYWSGHDLSELEYEYDYKKDENILHEALTPPTAKEVCEALSKLIGNAYYENKIFYENELKIEEICYLARDMGKNIDIIVFNNYSLPPHIITMIGRFYEGLENE